MWFEIKCVTLKSLSGDTLTPHTRESFFKYVRCFFVVTVSRQRSEILSVCIAQHIYTLDVYVGRKPVYSFLKLSLLPVCE